MPEALNSLRNSGSPSITASFSNASSSAILADTSPSAVRHTTRKKTKVIRECTGVGTHWCPRRNGAQTPRMEHASLAKQR